jgi:murein DD-endopeptidase MepM/ murein hydrolase activator NlpD
MIRLLAAGCVAVIVWAAAASHVPDQTRLPLSAVVPGAVVSQPFGCSTLDLEPFDPFCPTRHVHTGVDLAAPIGSAVYAATAGVARAGYDPLGAGIFVAVTFTTHVRILYCHLQRALVGANESVAAGQRIGALGATGLAPGPHVHFEIQVDGRYVDPGRWLAGPPA